MWGGGGGGGQGKFVKSLHLEFFLGLFFYETVLLLVISYHVAACSNTTAYHDMFIPLQ